LEYVVCLLEVTFEPQRSKVVSRNI
jgi:hypothetical protein